MKIYYLAFCLLFLSLSVAACGKPRVAQTQPLTPVTVQLAWTHQSQFAGMYAADQLGYYASEGLAVTFVEGGAQVDKFTPMLENTTQFGVGGADELIMRRSEGRPLKAIATIFRRSPIVFISLAEKGITRPQDFVGKTIRVSPNLALTLHAMMAWLGIGPDQYETVNLPSDMTLFASGDVPIWGAYINSIVVAIEQQGYDLHIIFPDDYGVHFYADTLFTTDEMIATNPEVVGGFVRATLKGWKHIVENPSESPAFLKNYSTETEDTIEYARMLATLPLVNTGEEHIGWMKPEVWADMEETLRRQTVLTAPLDVTQVYTMHFLEEIYK